MKKLFKTFNTVVIIITLLIGLNLFGQQSQFIGTSGKPFLMNTPKTGNILYDQISEPGASWIVSQHFSTVTNNTNTCAAADDFDIPEGETWDIHSVGILGSYWQGAPGGGDTLNVFILSDNNGMPGDTLHEYFAHTDFLNIEYPNGDLISTYFEIYLPSVVTLTEGTYWVSVQMYSSFDVTGQWGWLDRVVGTSINGNEWYWINPKDGFGFGYTSWTPANLLVGPWMQWDLSFAIYGVPDDNDISVIEISSPEGYYYGPPATPKNVTVKIKNEGSNPQTGFDLKYNFNGTEIIENIGNVTLDFNESHDFTFSQTVDLSSPGLYNLEVSSLLSGDENPANDLQSMDITVFDPTVYTMPSYSTSSITVCSGTFADFAGINGDLLVNDWGVLTIYPATPGAKIRLNFIQFDIGWSDFWIYDGENSLATELGYWEDDNSPGIITAGYNNTSGALTIQFVAQGWTPFESPGWAANISCHTILADDFEVMNVTLSNPAITENDYVTAFAQIKNVGSTALDKNVTFEANGVVFATVASGIVNQSDTIIVEAIWNPTLEGDYIIAASVPADLGNNNNLANITTHVYPFDYFYEGFELPLFPPDGWSQSSIAWTHHTYSPAVGGGHAYLWTNYGFFDTLYTPRLHIESGDKISFYSFSSPWWPGELDLCWIDAETGVASLIQAVPIPWGNYQYFEIDVSAAAGDNYLGFVGKYNSGGGQGEVKLDEVKGIGIEKFFYQDDLKAYTLLGDITPIENLSTTLEIEIKNIGSQLQLGSDYTVKLMQGPAGLELMSYDGQDINPKEVLSFTLDYTFPYAGLYNCYIEIDFADDQDVSNNISSSLNVYVQQEGTIENYIGINNDFSSNWWHPITVSTTGLYSQTLYLAEDVGEANTITGIMYYYLLNGSYPVYNNPITIWMSETSEINMSDSLEAANDYTLVFDGTFDCYPGNHGVFIPLDFVFSYQGGNLMVTTYKNYDVGGWGDFYVGTSHPDEIMVRYYNGYANGEPIDPYNQQSLDSVYFHQKMEYGNITFYKYELEGLYCTPPVLNGTAAGDFIDGVSFGSIENSTTGSLGGPAYNNFTSLSANVQRGRAYELTIQAESSSSNGSVSAWIDFNGNNLFDDEGEQVVHMSSNQASQEITVLVRIPDDAALGLTVLRVRNSATPDLFASCQAVDFGETEDYGINIIQTIQVYNPVPEFSATLQDDGNLDLNWAVPENPGAVQVEGFEMSTWPPQGGWEVKQSTTLTGPLTDPAGETWAQFGADMSFVYNGVFSALCPETGMDFNWLITPEVQLYSNDELSFMLNYSSDPNGYSKFYVMVESDGVWNTELEYTEEITMFNNYDVEVVVDLSGYAGKIVKLAFVSEYNNAYPIAIDQVILKGMETSGKSVAGITGYELHRNNELFSTIDDASVISATDLLTLTENYTYCIYVNYADGEESEMVCDEAFYLAPLTPPLNVNASADNNDVYVLWIAPDGGMTRFADDFEDYYANQQVACQNPDDWTTWTLSPCGVNDPYISADMPYSGDNSVVIQNQGDLLYLMDEMKTSGKYSFNFRMYIPSGFNGYFNVLQDHDLTIGALWGMQAFFDVGGIGTLDAGGYGSAIFLFDYDEWMYVEVIIDLDNDWGYFLINGVSVHQWPWSSGISGGGNFLAFEGGDFYAWDDNNTCKYYMDDFQIIQLYESEDFLTYNIYKDGGLLGNTTETDYTDTSVEPGYHEYCVSAVYDEGESSQVCDHVTLFSAPENFIATVQNENEVNCTWDEVSSSSLEGYYIYRDDIQVSGLVTGGEWTDMDVEGGTHTYYVTTVFTGGESLPSNIETVVVMIIPKNLTAMADGEGNIELNWDAAGVVLEGNLIELYQHDETPVNGLYQWFDFGYGVVFDLNAYPDATIEMADFHHASWGNTGTWSYMFHIVDWNTFTEIATAGPFQTTGNDTWEFEIPLGSITSTSTIGIFLEPMSFDPSDAYPILSCDVSMEGYSLTADLSDYTLNSPAPGDFLLDLWIWVPTGKKMVKAQKVKVDNMNVANARAPYTSVKGEITINQKEKEGKALTGYNVYYAHNNDPFAFLAITQDTTYSHVDAGYIQGLHKYYVTSQYEEGESEPSDIAAEYISGISENGLENLNIYPNPITDVTQINTAFTMLGIEVVNSQGQVILREESIKLEEYRLNLENQPSGIYNVRIESEEGWINRKLIKK